MDQEDKATDGVGATTAVVEDVGEALITALDNVLFEGAEQVGKKRFGEIEFGLGFLERGKDPSVGGVVGKALLGVLPCLAVLAKDLEALGFAGSGLERGLMARIGITFVGEIVGDTGEGIDSVDMVAKFFGDEASNRKVLVVGFGQLRAGLVGINRRGQGLGG